MTAPQPGPSPEPTKEHLKINVRTVVIAVIAIVLLIFVFENTQSVEIQFWIPTVRVPLWIALVISIVLGGIGGFLVGRSRYKPPKAPKANKNA